MALINCPECARQVSDKAAACPGCGCPTRNRGRSEGQYVTTQDTGKRFKALHLLGVLVLLVGVVATIGAWEDGHGAPLSWVLTIIVGLGIILWAKIGAWWHHR